MEILILISLVIIILLLLSDKYTITVRRSSRKYARNTTKAPFISSSVMGLPKPDRQLEPKPDNSRQEAPAPTNENKFEGLVNDASLEGKSEEPEITLEAQEFLEEEKAFRSAADLYPSTDYAQGVSFEELTKISSLIKKPDLAMDDAKQIIHIVKKIDGTEMMEMLESSMSVASKKIAALLNKNLVSVAGSSPILFDDFDISKFL